MSMNYATADELEEIRLKIKQIKLDEQRERAMADIDKNTYNNPRFLRYYFGGRLFCEDCDEYVRIIDVNFYRDDMNKAMKYDVNFSCHDEEKRIGFAITDYPRELERFFNDTSKYSVFERTYENVSYKNTPEYSDILVDNLDDISMPTRKSASTVSYNSDEIPDDDFDLSRITEPSFFKKFIKAEEKLDDKIKIGKRKYLSEKYQDKIIDTNVKLKRKIDL